MKNITITGVIGWDSTPEGLRHDLAIAAGDDVELEISSPGGFIAPGLEMFNLIRNYQGSINVRITGYAMSMASYLPLAVKSRKNPGRIIAEDNAVFMIHNARGIVGGDHNDVLSYGEYLSGLSGMIARRYEKVTNNPMEVISEWMDKETFFFGSEMVDVGFVDEIIETDNDDDTASAIAAAKASFSDCFSRMTADQARARADWHQAAAMMSSPEMKVGTYSGTIELRDEAWSKSDSESRWRDHANVESPDDLPNTIYSKRFAFVSDKESFGGHHFPIMDYKSGEFVNISAVRNGLSRLPQSNSVPQADKPRVERLLRRYLDRYNDENENNKHKEAQPMKLEDLLAANPEAKADYDTAIAAARNEGASAIRETIKQVTPFLTSTEYPAAVKNTAVEVLQGEQSVANLKAVVAAVDAVREENAATAALGENPGNTSGQQHGNIDPSAVVTTDEELNAAVDRMKGGN